MEGKSNARVYGLISADQKRSFMISTFLDKGWRYFQLIIGNPNELIKFKNQNDLLEYLSVNNVKLCNKEDVFYISSDNFELDHDEKDYKEVDKEEETIDISREKIELYVIQSQKDKREIELLLKIEDKSYYIFQIGRDFAQCHITGITKEEFLDFLENSFPFNLTVHNGKPIEEQYGLSSIILEY